MPANVPHAVRAPQRFKMLLTMLLLPVRRATPLRTADTVARNS